MRNHHPWYNDKVHESRRKRHRAERKWRHTRLEEDHDQYISANKTLNDCILEAKKSYYADKLSNADNKTVFQVVNSLLNNQNKLLPTFEDPKDLGTRFTRYFTNKISDIRDILDSDPDKPDVSQFSDHQPVSCDPFTEFVEMSPDEVRKVISNSSNNFSPT